jgi:hypothetical protein
MNVASKLNERSSRTTRLRSDDSVYRAVVELLEQETYTPFIDAWVKEPDTGKITWESLVHHPVQEALGYGSVAACQEAVDAMSSQVKLLTVCGETCLVRVEVIERLKQILGR